MVEEGRLTRLEEELRQVQVRADAADKDLTKYMSSSAKNNDNKMAKYRSK